MTLSDLYIQIKHIGNLFNTWQIPMDKEVHLELMDDNTVKVNVNQWISVDEELPKELHPVLLHITGESNTDLYDLDMIVNGEWLHNGENNITHWMHIPKIGDEK